MLQCQCSLERELSRARASIALCYQQNANPCGKRRTRGMLSATSGVRLSLLQCCRTLWRQPADTYPQDPQCQAREAQAHAGQNVHRAQHYQLRASWHRNGHARSDASLVNRHPQPALQSRATNSQARRNAHRAQRHELRASEGCNVDALRGARLLLRVPERVAQREPPLGVRVANLHNWIVS